MMAAELVESVETQVPRVRFTIRSLMISVAIVACVLGIPYPESVLLLWLLVPAFALVGAWWLAARGCRRLAALSFGGVAILTNALYVAACIRPHYMILPALLLGWPLIAMPTIAGLGIAWARSATRNNAIPRRSSATAWLLVVALTAFPMVTVSTLWPLRLAFLVARPSLAHLADQAAAGRTLVLPQQAGLFQVVRIDVDTRSGNVGLILDPDPSGPTGLVRNNPRTISNGYGPISASGMGVDLGWGWEYRQED